MGVLNSNHKTTKSDIKASRLQRHTTPRPLPSVYGLLFILPRTLSNPFLVHISFASVEASPARGHQVPDEHDTDIHDDSSLSTLTFR
ncbi:hypothetical protein VTJ04DRAFT_6706 [Mycothermus thermophilus]|uniref:uncharacterized protein n=1 Tax=Humicola insolens TaxID=85995 RepID=UPI0037438EAE